MKRRAFLKFIATVYGAAVVCPIELLKGKTELKIGIGPGWYVFSMFTEEQRKKYHQNIVKARQQGCINNILYGIPYWCDIPLIIGAYDETIQTTH